MSAGPGAVGSRTRTQRAQPTIPALPLRITPPRPESGAEHLRHNVHNRPPLHTSPHHPWLIFGWVSLAAKARRLGAATPRATARASPTSTTARRSAPLTSTPSPWTVGTPAAPRPPFPAPSRSHGKAVSLHFCFQSQRGCCAWEGTCQPPAHHLRRKLGERLQHGRVLPNHGLRPTRRDVPSRASPRASPRGSF